MPRYIDTDKINYQYLPIPAIGDQFITKSAIDNMPEENVAEVKHGEWVPSEYQPHHTCSVCGHWFSLYDKVNYCPNCGAKMNRGSE